MNFYWLTLAGLTAFGAMTYNMAVRAAADQINPFYFSVILTLVALAAHVVALGIYRAFTSENIFSTSVFGIWMAVLTGISVAVIDLAFFYGVKQGGLIPTTIFWVVGGTILTILAGWLVFKENMDLQKTFGLGLALVSLVLLLKE